MKHPLQALLIANDPNMREDILIGVKKITIREGDRDYRPGLVMIVDHIHPFVVQATIVSVRKCKLAEVTEEEFMSDGFESADHLLFGMREYYPSLTWDSIVTVIKWDDVTGRYVDHPEDWIITIEV